MRIVTPGDPRRAVDLFTGVCRRCGCQVADVEKREARIQEGDRHWEPAALLLDCPTAGCTGDIFLEKQKPGQFGEIGER